MSSALGGTLPPDLDPQRLLADAAAILDQTTDRFLSGVGAPSAVAKGHNDFATEFDLELERTISAELAQRTQIAVHGEEFGGPDLTEGTVWVVDPDRRHLQLLGRTADRRHAAGARPRRPAGARSDLACRCRA